jgi:DNA-binding GntR family transcriptional regulator
MSGRPDGWRIPRTADLPLRPVTKTDLAYVQIRQKILEGDLAPEASLDQEALAGSLGLSTTPVREALRRLESERLVVSRAHRETVVAPLSLDIMEEVYAVRFSLDPLAAALAATEADAGERDQIAGVSLDRPDKDDPLSEVYFNRHLHRSIYAASRNTTLIEILDSLWDLSDRYWLIAAKDSRPFTAAGQEHAAIVAAVVEGKPDLAAELMREHLRATLRQIRAAVTG